MVTPYTALMDKDCKGPSSVVIVREETVDLDDCIDLCDSRSDCAVVVFTDDRYYSANVYGPLYVYEEGYTRGCWLKYGCNGEILDLNGVSSHIKNGNGFLMIVPATLIVSLCISNAKQMEICGNQKIL